MATAVEVDPSTDPFYQDSITRYLSIYNADIDWMPHLKELREKLFRKHGEQQGAPLLRQQISATILLPVHDRHAVTDPPQKLLFWVSSYSQFGGNDWVEEYVKTFKKDREIEAFRRSLIDELGIIHPIEYVPIARQAYRWLCEQVDQNVDKDQQAKAKKRMENIVFAYGGAAVCNVFNKPEYSKKINRLTNWRTGYFFEKLLHEVYKKEELYKIKQVELNKIDKNLIKKVAR